MLLELLQEMEESNIYALLTKREVKMAGDCPSSFFAFRRGP